MVCEFVGRDIARRRCDDEREGDRLVVLDFRGDDGSLGNVVVLREGEAIPIQVTWDEPKPRHEKGLQAFYERHPHAGEALYVTSETFGSLSW